MARIRDDYCQSYNNIQINTDEPHPRVSAPTLTHTRVSIILVQVHTQE